MLYLGTDGNIHTTKGENPSGTKHKEGKSHDEYRSLQSKDRGGREPGRAAGHRDRGQEGPGPHLGEKEAILRACEGRDYILRNRAEAWAVMNILFFRVKAEMDAYRDLSGAPQSWTPDEIAEQRTRFISLWQVIEEAELAGEYEAWQYAGCPTA